MGHVCRALLLCESEGEEGAENLVLHELGDMQAFCAELPHNPVTERLEGFRRAFQLPQGEPQLDEQAELPLFDILLVDAPLAAAPLLTDKSDDLQVFDKGDVPALESPDERLYLLAASLLP